MITKTCAGLLASSVKLKTFSVCRFLISSIVCRGTEIQLSFNIYFFKRKNKLYPIGLPGQGFEPSIFLDRGLRNVCFTECSFLQLDYISLQGMYGMHH
jgi:hypothetical protein